MMSGEKEEMGRGGWAFESFETTTNEMDLRFPASGARVALRPVRMSTPSGSKGT